MGDLRTDLRKYEAEKKTKVKGPIWPHIRCLWCPVSFFGCRLAGKSLRAEKS
jgi:hypothetical protein